MSKYLDIVYFDDKNSQGYALTIFFTKCSHMCEGCHNPSTWNDSENSKSFDINTQDKLISHYKENERYYDVLVLSGGDPMHKDNIGEITKFACRFKELFPDKEIWLYTGYTLNQIYEDKSKVRLMELCDYIKCGRYIKELSCTNNVQYSIRLATSNQKIYKKGLDY